MAGLKAKDPTNTGCRHTWSTSKMRKPTKEGLLDFLLFLSFSMDGRAKGLLTKKEYKNCSVCGQPVATIYYKGSPESDWNVWYVKPHKCGKRERKKSRTNP